MDGNRTDDGTDLFADLVNLAAPLQWGQPWEFLLANELIRGPIVNASEALATLRQKYSLEGLQQANLVEPAQNSGWRLRRELSMPNGAIIGMRRTSTGRVSYLMTARGSLPERLDPLALAARDHITLERIKQSSCLYATFSARDAAVLIANGLPAVVGFGPRNIDWPLVVQYRSQSGPEAYEEAMRPFRQQLMLEASLDGASNAEVLPSTGVEPPPTPIWPAPGYAPGSQPMVVIVGWSPARLTVPYRRLIMRAAEFFVNASRDMDVDFAISVWQPDRLEIERLRARLKWRDLPKINEILSEMLANDRYQFDLNDYAPANATTTAQTYAPPLDFVTAREKLIYALMGGDLRPDAILLAKAEYRECVQRDLIRPMYEAVIAESDPLVRMSGVNLVASSSLLHEMGPHMHAYLDKMLGLQEPDDRIPEAYLRLHKQLSSVLRDYCDLRKS